MAGKSLGRESQFGSFLLGRFLEGHVIALGRLTQLLETSQPWRTMTLMSTARPFRTVSVEDYLGGEQHARHKHEYVEGVVYAMVGGTNVHNRIATNATGSLHQQLRGKACQVFNSDTKVRIRQVRGTRFYYPDILVACQLNPASDTFQDQPVVIVEVLSESTRRTDENEKREVYLSIDSLCQYILVESGSIAAVVQRRADGGFPRETYIGGDAVIDLPEIGCKVPLSEVFEKVEFPPAIAEEEGPPDWQP